MKKVILIGIITVLSVLDVTSQNLKFLSQKQVFMREVKETVIEDSTKTANVIIDINMGNKKIEIINKTGSESDQRLTFSSFDVDPETKAISYYFDSKEIKVAILFKKWMSIQYKDGRIINYIVAKQL